MSERRRAQDNTELENIKSELNHEKQSRRKDGVRRVMAAMIAGKDVSALAIDMLNLSQTQDLAMRRQIYIFMVQCARDNPDMSMMAVNSLMKACEDHQPLMRALGLRSMASMGGATTSEHLPGPLEKHLVDPDPFVRKTAVLCIAKVHKCDPKLLKHHKFGDVKQYLSDPNPAVVANTVATLAEIQETANGKPADISSAELNLLLSALNECGEWGQVCILDYVGAYIPVSPKEAMTICERVTNRLTHSNAGVVMATVKVIVRMMTHIKDEEFCAKCDQKMSNPLMTMLTWPAELQYVALCNITIILQQRPKLLAEQVAIFFVKYNDPLCVKLGKLDIITRLASPANITKVLKELKAYTGGVDIDFARKAVRAIGLCAIKIAEFSEACVVTLCELARDKVCYITQEAIVVIRDIFRKYPNKYEAIIGTFCENLETLEEPEAKAALIWILGEYASRIDNSDELLASFAVNFHDEAPQVKLQLLTAVVKQYLKKPGLGSERVMRVLDMCTKESEDPDLRDRGYIYWRMLSSDPSAAREIVLSKMPTISEEIDYLEPNLLREMIKHIGSLASVTMRPPAFTFDTTSIIKSKRDDDLDIPSLATKQSNDLIGFDEQLLMPENSKVQDDMTLDSLFGTETVPQPAHDPQPTSSFGFSTEPLSFTQPSSSLGFSTDPVSFTQPTSSLGFFDEPVSFTQPTSSFGFSNEPVSLTQPISSPGQLLMDFDLNPTFNPPDYPATETLESFPPWVSKVTSPQVQMAVSWNRGESISGFVDILGDGHLTLNEATVRPNSFGLILPFQPKVTTKSNKHISFEIQIVFQQNSTVMSSPLIPPILVVSTNLGTVECAVHQAVMFAPTGHLTQFHQSWWNGSQSTTQLNFGLLPFSDESRLSEELRKLNIFVLTRETDDLGRTVLCASMKFDNSALVLVKFVLSFGERSGMAHVVCPNDDARSLASEGISMVMTANW